MPRYELQVFISRNTCKVDHPELAGASAAHELARTISLTNTWPVVILAADRSTFIQYEDGKLTEWSANPLK